METPSVRTLIKAGFHFGHRTSRWNPKMAPFIFKRRNLIHIIDLRATLRGLITARELARAVASRGQYVLFVGTKKQASELVEREGKRCGMPYVSERWLGGLLTNYTTIRRRLDRLVELEGLEQSGQIQLYGKKMVSALRRERRKILRNLGGVRNLDRLPGLLVIVDPAREYIAVREAGKLDIPIVALTDTDGDPENVDVVVPGNDDSFGAVEVFLKTIADAVPAGLSERAMAGTEAPADAETEESFPEEAEQTAAPAEQVPAQVETAQAEANGTAGAPAEQ